jgi:hypothetical protein
MRGRETETEGDRDGGGQGGRETETTEGDRDGGRQGWRESLRKPKVREERSTVREERSTVRGNVRRWEI